MNIVCVLEILSWKIAMGKGHISFFFFYGSYFTFLCAEEKEMKKVIFVKITPRQHN